MQVVLRNKTAIDTPFPPDRIGGEPHTVVFTPGGAGLPGVFGMQLCEYWGQPGVLWMVEIRHEDDHNIYYVSTTFTANGGWFEAEVTTGLPEPFQVAAWTGTAETGEKVVMLVGNVTDGLTYTVTTTNLMPAKPVYGAGHKGSVNCIGPSVLGEFYRGVLDNSNGARINVSLASPRGLLSFTRSVPHFLGYKEVWLPYSPRMPLPGSLNIPIELITTKVVYNEASGTYVVYGTSQSKDMVYVATSYVGQINAADIPTSPAQAYGLPHWTSHDT